MHRNQVVRSLFLPVVVLALSAGVSPADGEISLLATGTSGEYGTGVDSDTQWLTLRYVTGSRVQFRADLSMIRTETSTSGVTFTGPGAMSNGRRGPGSMQSSSTSGIGDVRLALSTPVLGGGAKLFRVDGSVEVKLPTADERRHLGTGEIDYRVGLAGEYRTWSVAVFGGLGWNALGETAALPLDDVLDAYVGLDSSPFAGGRLIASGWLEGWQPAIDGAGDRVVLGLGLRTTGKVRWRLQARSGLTDASEDLALVAGLSFGISPSGPGVRGHER